MIVTAVGGTLNNKTSKQAINLFESKVINSYQWNPTQAKLSRIVGIYDIDTITVLAAQVEVINKNLDGLTLMNLAPVMS